MPNFINNNNANVHLFHIITKTVQNRPIRLYFMMSKDADSPALESANGTITQWEHRHKTKLIYKTIRCKQ